MNKENTQESDKKSKQPPPKPPRLDNIYIVESYSKKSLKINNKDKKESDCTEPKKLDSIN